MSTSEEAKQVLRKFANKLYSKVADLKSDFSLWAFAHFWEIRNILQYCEKMCHMH